MCIRDRGIAYLNGERRACAWYSDRTMSCGTTRDLDSISIPQIYSMPSADYLPVAIKGIAWVEHRNMACAWYRNAKVSCGTRTNLGVVRPPQDFKRLE